VTLVTYVKVLSAVSGKLIILSILLLIAINLLGMNIITFLRIGKTIIKVGRRSSRDVQKCHYR